MNMRTLFHDMIDLTATTSTEDSLRAAVARITTKHGFERFAYLNLDAVSARSFAVSNYPQDWQAMYFGRSYMALDPVVTMGKRMMRAFQWCVDEQRRRATKDERGFWDAASQFGIRAGVTVPIRVCYGQVAMLTLASSQNLRPREFCETECAVAATSATFLHSRLVSTNCPTTQRQPGLSDREALCLGWIAAGKSMQDIAEILGLNYHTVRWDLDNIRAKLNVKNLKQALSLALQLGLI